MLQNLRKRLSFSNIVALLALFIALGGSAYAVGKNSVGTKQLKNNAVTAKKIKKNAVTTAKVKNGAITGAKVKLSSLGTVPSATKAATADSATTAGTATSAGTATTATSAASADALKGQQTVFLKLADGESKIVMQHGVVALRATCSLNDGGSDILRITAETTQNGAILAGDDTLNGGPSANDFLNVNTPEGDREFEEETDTAGQTYVDAEIDSGFVLGPDGKAIVANTEGAIMGLNYLDSACIYGGVFNTIG